MAVSFHPFRALSTTAGAFRDDLMFGTGDRDGQRQILRKQIAQLSAAWPFALVALLTAPVILWGAAVAQRRFDLYPAIQIRGGALITAGLIILLLLRSPLAQRVTPHAQVRTVTLLGGCIAAALFSLLGIGGQLVVSAADIAGFVSIFGAIIVIAVVLHPVRAATIGFAGALVVGITVQTGLGLPALIALTFLLCLAIATYSMARLDRAAGRGI